MRKTLLITALTLTALSLLAQRNHPNLILTQRGIQAIKDGLGKYPLLDETIRLTRAEVDRSMAEGIDVPVPVDAGGGYSHEKHKANQADMLRAATLWQVLGEEKYAQFVRDMLLEYARLYPTLDAHPVGSRHTAMPGRLFWQSLNDAVWLVSAIQAYDAVFDYISPNDRRFIEDSVFRLAVNFNMTDGRSFNRANNHGTWAVAGVIMAGYVLGEPEWVEKGLRGGNLDGEAGLFRQIDRMFSPDGFYAEGAYYLRYAYWPFCQTAVVIQNNQPELNIFAYRDSMLVTAPTNLLTMTDGKGQFLPFNNAIIEKGWDAQEIITLVNVLYSHRPKPELLYIAQRQGRVMLSEEGVMVARAVAEGKSADSYHRPSVFFRDGDDGTRGGMGFLRHGNGDDQVTLTMKYTSDGGWHGHFDKLSMMFYDQNVPIFQDYGAVRYLNIVQKHGGRYLSETDSWARQTVAHNTVVVDQTSNYGGDFRRSGGRHSNAFYFDASNPRVQVMSAYDTCAYPGVTMHRTMALIANEGWENPFVIDIFRLASPNTHTYDLVFNHPSTVSMIETAIPYNSHQTWSPMGTDHGYQHLFNTAQGIAQSDHTHFTFYKGRRFYTLTTTTVPNHTEVFFTQLGANDAGKSLRPERGIILRNAEVGDFTFASIIEPHGVYNEPFEYVRGAHSRFESIQTLKSDSQATITILTERDGTQWVFATANNTADPTARHSHTVAGRRFEWVGAFMFAINNF
jgi:hypothetical protein